ncbi:MAG: hypothetical protein WAM94_01965 [Chromatiaceae bacterium]
MSLRFSTLTSAALLGALMIAGTVIPAQAGDGCDKDKKDNSTSSLWSPAVPGGSEVLLSSVVRS